MKLKLNQTRTYDDDGYRRRAACLCLQSEDRDEVLLVTSSRFSHLWIIPGGGLDPGEDPVTAALREIGEEAGVCGKLLDLLDVFENSIRKTRTYVYVVIVEQLNDDYEDLKKIGRMRKWFTFEEACGQLQVHKPVQKMYIGKFIEKKKMKLMSPLCDRNLQLVPKLYSDSRVPGEEETKKAWSSLGANFFLLSNRVTAELDV